VGMANVPRAPRRGTTAGRLTAPWMGTVAVDRPTRMQRDCDVTSSKALSARARRIEREACPRGFRLTGAGTSGADHEEGLL
jgi:hypothetical protein